MPGLAAFSGRCLPTANGARFFVVFSPAYFRQDTVLLYLAIKAFEQTIDAFFLTSLYFSQWSSLPL